MTADACRVLVACLGNELRGDDAFGLRVAERLHGRLDPDVRLLAHRGASVTLLELWRGCPRVILVDATRAEWPVGEVRVIDVSTRAAPATLRAHSSHTLGPLGTIELARALGELPPQIEIVAIAGQAFGLGEPMSDAVEAQVEPVVERVLAMTRAAD